MEVVWFLTILEEKIDAIAQDVAFIKGRLKERDINKRTEIAVIGVVAGSVSALVSVVAAILH